MKKRKWIWIVLAAVLIVAVLTISNPQIRTNIFVRLYHEQIEEGLRINAGVPADDAVLFGYKYVNTWEGEHSMVEFLIGTRGDTYYGCYYSPDGKFRKRSERERWQLAIRARQLARAETHGFAYCLWTGKTRMKAVSSTAKPM